MQLPHCIATYAYLDPDPGQILSPQKVEFFTFTYFMLVKGHKHKYKSFLERLIQVYLLILV
jgi:hypothetical protein